MHGYTTYYKKPVSKLSLSNIKYSKINDALFHSIQGVDAMGRSSKGRCPQREFFGQTRECGFTLAAECSNDQSCGRNERCCGKLI